VRLVAELVVGVVYVAGAGFNTIHTLRHSRQLYGEFATDAWLSSAGTFIGPAATKSNRSPELGTERFEESPVIQQLVHPGQLGRQAQHLHWRLWCIRTR